MTFEIAWERAARVPGWLTKREGRCLHQWARSPWLEIGCWLGRSTTILASSGPGTVIDTFLGTPSHDQEVGYAATHDIRDGFLRNTVGLPVWVIQADFRDSPLTTTNLEFLYLDADHSEGATEEAFAIYAPRVRRGGLVAFHDVGDPGWPDVEPFVTGIGWAAVAAAGRVRVLQKP